MAITNVQGWKNQNTAGTPNVLSFTSNPGTNNTLFACFMIYSGGVAVTPPTVTDTIGNSWIQDSVIGDATNGQQYVFRCSNNISNGSVADSVTIASSGAASINLFIAEFNLAGTPTLDRTAAQLVVNSTAINSGVTAARSVASELLLGVCHAGGPGNSVTSMTAGWTSQIGSTNSTAAEYLIVSSVGTDAATGVAALAQNSLAIVCTYSVSTGITPPSQAVSAGFTRLDFNDEFDVAPDIGFNTRGHKWNAGLWWQNVPDVACFTQSGSVLTITDYKQVAVTSGTFTVPGANSTVAVNTAAAHGLVVGDVVDITDATHTLIGDVTIVNSTTQVTVNTRTWAGNVTGLMNASNLPVRKVSTGIDGVELSTQEKSHGTGHYWRGGYFEARMNMTDWAAFVLYSASKPAGPQIVLATLATTSTAITTTGNPGNPQSFAITISATTLISVGDLVKITNGANTNVFVVTAVTDSTHITVNSGVGSVNAVIATGATIQRANSYSLFSEIDIIETDPSTALKTVTTNHFNTASGTVVIADYQSFPNNNTAANSTVGQFNIFGCLWTKNTISWYFNNVLQTSFMAGTGAWQQHFIDLVAGMGGVNGGASTVNPPTNQIDWVRVWQPPLPSPGGGIVNVQPFIESHASAGTVSKAFASNVTVGNKLFVCASHKTSFSGPPGITDTLGNQYVLVPNSGSGGSGSSGIFYCENIASGPCTVTATFAGGTYVALHIAEFDFSGSEVTIDQQTNVVDGAASLTSNSGNTLTRNVANELLIGFHIPQGTATLTSGNTAGGWTARIASDSLSLSQYKIVSAVGTDLASTATQSASQPYTALIATFYSTAAAPTNPTVPTGFSATAISSSSIQINWTASTGGSGGIHYVVQHKTGAASFTTIATTGVGVVTVTDTGLTASTLYSYQIQAVDSIGATSAFTSTFSATTQTGGPPPPTIFNATDVSRAAVQTAITSATNSFNSGTLNNQVNIPSGSGTWSTPITITVPMAVLGAGQGTTNIHNSTSAPSGSGSETPTFIIQLGTDGRMEIGNFTLTADTGGSGQPNSSNGIQLVIGALMPTQIVIRDITFSGQDFAIYNGGNGDSVMIGVVARCTFTNIRIAARNSGYFNPARLHGFTYPSPAWGTINYFVYEDCTFNLGPNWNPFAQASYFFDTEYPMNYMVRFCTFTANRASGVEVDGFDEHGNYNSASANPPIIAMNNLGMVLHDNTLNILGGTSVGTQLCDVRGGIGNVIFNNTITGQANNSIKIRADPDLSTQPSQTYFANNTNPNGTQIPVNAASGTTGPNFQSPPVLGTNYFVASGSSGILSILPNYTEIAHPHPFLTSTPDTTPPTVPGGITSSSPNPGQINLSWTASSDPPNAASTISYIIQRALGASGIFSTVFTTGPGITSYADGGLSQNTLYRYQIAAQDSASNQSAFSTIISQTTAAGSTIPSFVQEVDVDNGSTSSTTGVVIFTNQQVRGNTNLICVSWRGTATISNVHDSALNTYTSAGPVVAGTDTVTGFVRSQQLYYSTNISTFANNTLTATMSAASTNIVVRAIEYFGISQSSPIDVISSNSGTSANPSAGPITLSQTNDMLVGLPYGGSSVSSITSGFTQRNSAFSLVEDQLATTIAPPGQQTINLLDGQFSTVSNALTSPTTPAGSTLVIPAGTWTWTTRLNISKSITIQGAGSTGANITKIINNVPYNNARSPRLVPPSGDDSSVIGISFTIAQGDQPVRITGIYFDNLTIPQYKHVQGYEGPGVSGVTILGQSHNDYSAGSGGYGDLTLLSVLTKVRIDHCYFNAGKSQIALFGKVFGCIDNNTFNNGDIGVSLWGCDDDNWPLPGPPNTPGTLNAMFVENNTFLLDNNVSWYTNDFWSIDHQVYHALGSKGVIRDNLFDLSHMTLVDPSGFADNDNYFIDVHGNQGYYNPGHFNFRGQPIVEIYRNTCKANKTYQWMELRGGSIICWNNTMTVTSGIAAVELWEEEYWSSGNFGGVLRTGPWPAEDQINASFFYGNTINGSNLVVGTGGSATLVRGNPRQNVAAEQACIQLNRDFWTTPPSASTVVSGGYPQPGSPSVAGYPKNYWDITSYTPQPAPHPFQTGGQFPLSAWTASVGFSSSTGWVMHLVALKSAGADTIAPSVPGSPSAVGASQSSITISWTTSTDNIDPNLSLVYPIEYMGGGVLSFTQISPVATGVASGTDTFTHTGLIASTAYTYRMRAQDTSGNLSAYTSNFSGSTLSPDTTPPNAPSGLTATAVSSSQINLTWNASSDPNTPTNQITYLIERQLGAGLFNQVGISAAPSNLTFQDTGLSPLTAYNYRIRAEDPSLNLSPYFPSVAPYPTATTLAALANVAPVQNASGLQASTGTTVTKVFSSAQNAGDGNIVTVAYPSTVTVTVTDNSNGTTNPYALAASFPDSSTAYTIAVYYRTNIKAAAANANTVTALFSASIAAGASSIHISEWSNMANYRPVDSFISSFGSGTTANSGTLTTAHANDLLYAVGLPAQNFTSTGVGYTLLTTDNNGVMDEYQIVSATGSYSASGGIANGGAWTMGLVAFKSNAAVSPSFAYPVKVSANNRYLVDQNNAPFLLFADAAWSMVTDISLADADYFFRDRLANGFNSIFFSLFAGSGAGGPTNFVTIEGTQPFTGFTSGTIATTGDGSANNYDIATPNAPYFTKVKNLISMAAAYGFTVMLNPTENYGWEINYNSRTTAVLTTFGTFVGSQFSGFPNLIYCHGNDYQDVPSSDTKFLAFVNAIKSADTTTPHIHTFELNFNSSVTTNDANWQNLNLNFAYTYYPSYAQCYIGYLFSPAKPVFLGETQYAGFLSYGNADEGTVANYRRQSYWGLCSGTTGYLSGDLAFDFPAAWKSDLEDPMIDQVGFLLNVLNSNAWYNLIPDISNTLVTGGFGTSFNPGNANPGTLLVSGSTAGTVGPNTYVTSSITPDGTFAVSYTPVSTTLTVAMSKFSGPVTAKWMDPSNGVQTTVVGSPFTNAGTQAFATPGTTSDGLHDWVLIFNASASSTQTVNLLGILSAESFSGLLVQAPTTITLSGIVSAEAFGTLSVNAPSTVTLSGIPSAQLLAGLSISGTGTATVTLSGIPSVNAIGIIRVDAPATVTLSGIPSAQLISGLRVDAPATFFISGILSLQQFGNILVQSTGDQTVTLSGISSAETFFGLSISATGTATVTLLGIPSAQAVGHILIQGTGPQSVILDGILSAELFGSTHVVGSGGPARMARVL